MNPFINELVHHGQVRVKYLYEKWLTQKFPTEFASGETQELDRAIMKYTGLGFWIRPYMREEIQKEHDNMLCGNMLNDDAVKACGEFLEDHNGSTCRLVVVLNSNGIRVKEAMFFDISNNPRYFTLKAHDIEGAAARIHYMDQALSKMK